MNAEQNAEPASRLNTGRFAILTSPLCVGGIGARSVRSLAGGLGAALACLIVLLFGPSAASAHQARLFAGSFGAASNPAPYPANPYPLGSPASVAVDSSSHDIYVADRPNHRVEKFDAAGNFLFMLGKEVNQTKSAELGSTEAERNLCPVDPGDLCQAGKAGTTPGAFDELKFLAVDPTSGDLYVADNHSVTNEEQNIAISATGGSFTLSFEGETTTPIAFNAPARNDQGPGSLQAALELLPSIADAFEPSGSPGAYRIRFRGRLAGIDVPQITCDGSALSGAGSSCTATTLLQGSPASARVTKFDSAGHLVETWGTSGQLDGSTLTSPPAPHAGPFGQILGLAVDPAGHLWVNATGTTFEFDSAAKPLDGFSESCPPFVGVCSAGPFAIDSLDNLYFIGGNEPIRAAKFDATGKPIGLVASSSAEKEEHQLDPELGRVFVTRSPAVDVANDELYLAGTEGSFELHNEKGIVKRYDSTCHPVIVEEPENLQPGCEPAEAFGAGLIGTDPPLGIAIDSSSKAVYVANYTDGVIASFAFLTVPDVVTAKPVNPTHSSATLTGTVDPDGVELNPGTEGCRFEYVEAAHYEPTAANPYAAGQVKACETEGGGPIGNGSSPVPVHADLTGLQAGVTYHYRLVATNHNDENEFVHEPSFGADVAFGPPLVEGASALSVSSDAAEIQAEVNPDSLDTNVRIQYVTQSHFEATGFSEPLSTPAQDIGSAGSTQTPTFELSGLSPHTAYRYRVLAENVLGEGPEAAIGPAPPLAFTTQAATPFSLPDSRQWQQVSPPNKLGAKIEPVQGLGVVQAAVSGQAITYLTATPTDAEPEGYAQEQQTLSTRGAEGWSTRGIGNPHFSPTGSALAVPEYKYFDSALTLGVVQPYGEFDASLSSEASGPTAFLHDLSGTCGGNCYRPLVTAKEGFANVPEGTEIDEGENCTSSAGKPSQGRCGPRFVGATEDLRHVVLSPEHASLNAGGVPNELYEWAAGEPLTPVSVLPEGEQTAADLGFASQDLRGAISADGSRVFWMVGTQSEPDLYLRDLARGETIQLDAADPACLTAHQCQSGGGRFVRASADGSRAFFTDSSRLTAGSGEAGTTDLYECRIVINGEEKLACELTDLTPKQGGESASVQGVLDGSTDGSYLYFVAQGVLAGNTVENGAGEEAARAGQPNLYVIHEGTTTYITTLSSEDRSDWGAGKSGLPDQPSRVSPNGHWLEFMSQRSLTGNDNRDLATGRPVAEVYLYDAADDRLDCASCDPTNARPNGVEYGQLQTGLVGGAGNIWPPNGLVAANVPGWTSFGDAGQAAGHQPRYLTDEGRLFFNSIDALLPQDSNDNQDVYQYEPPGVGGCTGSSPTFGPVSGGCVGLISAGTSREESAFLDASESGEDVFFLTYSKLAPQDEDAALDVYDAHSCTAASPCLPNPPAPAPACQGDACQNPVTPPNDPTPGSLTFQGAGNLTECPKGRALKGGRCVKQKAKKKHHKKKTHRKHKRAGSNRGGDK